jgi:hypothetical protein
MGLILMATIAVRYASPIKDGDFFWHAAYAKYMIENKTLIPDHSIYSWTPADNTKIKCNWFAEILLYLMYEAGGLNLLFAFRYGCYVFVFLILVAFTLKVRKKVEPLHLFIISIALFSSSGASFIKPELLSLLYFSLLYFVFFNAKFNQTNEKPSNSILYIPLIFLFWANSHEVVLFGLITFGLIFCGEILNFLLKSSARPNISYLKRLGLASAGAVIAFFINPYGHKFPLNLANFLYRSNENSLGNIEAYHSIFFGTFSGLYYFDYWVIMIVMIVSISAYLRWKNKELDWAIILPTLFLSAIYLKYVRATYYWPSFWAMSMIYQFGRLNAGRLQSPVNISISYKKAISALTCIIMLFLSCRIVDTSIRKPFLGQYFGFGAGYSNPVQSSDFLKKYRPGNRLYNSYAVGGYLTYALYPVYQIFMDSRYFPYTSWYNEYYDFSHGKTTLKAFSEKYPFNVAVVDYHYSKDTINEFMMAKDWYLAFYGTAAAVFVKRGSGFDFDYTTTDRNRFAEFRSIFQAYTVFNFAQNIGDLKTAEYIYNLMHEKFAYMKDYDLITHLSSLSLNGLQAMQSGNYDIAYDVLERYGLRPYMRSTNKAILQLRRRKVRQLIEKGELKAALDVLEKTLSKLPEHFNSLYNAGIIGYMLENNNKNKHIENNRWRFYLEKVIHMAQDRQASQIAKMLLEGKIKTEKVPLMF